MRLAETALKAALPALSCLLLCACRAHAPLQVLMVNGELFFLLEDKPQVMSVSVERAGTAHIPRMTMWLAGCSEPEEEQKGKKKEEDSSLLRRKVVREDKCRTRQVKYGAGGAYLPSLSAPQPLRKYQRYEVRVDMAGGRAAMEDFSILGENSLSVRTASPSAKKGLAVVETAAGPLSVPYSAAPAGEPGRSELTAAPAGR